MQPSAARNKTAGPEPIDSLAGDVQYYLTLTPRQLPSRYLYDPLGSALFEAICELPWYRITKTERGLLERSGGRGAVDLEVDQRGALGSDAEPERRRQHRDDQRPDQRAGQGPQGTEHSRTTLTRFAGA